MSIPTRFLSFTRRFSRLARTGTPHPFLKIRLPTARGSFPIWLIVVALLALPGWRPPADAISTTSPLQKATFSSPSLDPNRAVADASATGVSLHTPGTERPLVSDKHVEINAPSEPVVRGKDLTLEVTYFNTQETSGGPFPISGVSLTIFLPSIFTNPMATPPEEWVCDDPQSVSDGQEITCEPEDGTMDAGEQATVDVEVKADEEGAGTVTAEGEANEFDPDTSDNTDAAEIIVTDEEAESTRNTVSDGTAGDPVSTFTGEVFLTEAPDLALGGPLPVHFERYYGSFLERDGRVESALGPGWAHSFDWHLYEINAQNVYAVSWRGRVLRFENQEGTWTQVSLPERPYQLVEESNGYRMANPRSQRIYTFDAEGNLTTIADGKGNELTLSYDGSGQLMEVSDGLGRTLTFSYDGDRLTSVSDGSRTVQFGYSGGLLTGVTDPLGNTTTYSYDAGSSFTGLLAEKTRPGGNTVLNQTYDAEGRVASQTDAVGNTTTFAYSIDEQTGQRTTTVTDPLGNTSQHVHNADGQLLSATDASGQTITIGYSDGGQRDQITDRLGDDTQYVYDSASRLPITITDARGGVTSLSYSTRSDDGFEFQELTGVSRPDGTSLSYSYDADGNLISVTGPAGNTWSLTYNGRGQPLTVTNPEGGTTTYSYNGDGTLASVEDPSGNTTSYSYDALLRPTSVTRPDGFSRTFSYDDASRLTSTTDEEGRTYGFTYDANGNLTSITDPSGASIQRSYDARDRLTSRTDRTGQSVSYSYDAHGRLISRTDRAGNTTSYDYNAEDRLTSITNGAGDTWTLSYDDEGVPTALTNPEGETTTLTSNSMGWITRISSPLGNATRASYDAMGRATSLTDPSGGTTQLSRDSRGLLDGMTLPGGASASYSRDGLGLLESRTGPAGGSWQTPRDAQGRITGRTDPLGRTASRTYDSRNRVTSVDLPGGLGTLDRSFDATGNLTGLSHSGGPSLSFTYDTNGRLTSATGLSLSRDAEGRITENNGLTITRDAEGRIASLALPGGTVQYRYDGAGRLTEVEDWMGGTTAFSYDKTGRLTEINRPNGTTTAYTYNAEGRIVTIVETGPEGDTLASSTLTRDARGNVTRAERSGPLTPQASPQSESFSYDQAGQVQSFSYDALGRLSEDAARTYSWDGLSRLESYSDGTQTASFTYDAFELRTSKSRGGTERSYVWNYALGLPSVAVQKKDGTDQRYYVHAPNGMLLYDVEAGTGSRRFYHYDEMGNTTLLTGEGGTVEGAYAYGPYGRVLAQEGDAQTPFTWQGEFGVMAEGGGLYYMRARYYDASARRFLSRDPIRSLRPDEISPYQYARANPRRFVDPAGLQSNTLVFPFVQDGRVGDLEAGSFAVRNRGSSAVTLTATFWDPSSAQNEDTGNSYPVTVSIGSNEVGVGTVIVEERSTSGVSLHTLPEKDRAEGLVLPPANSREGPREKGPSILEEGLPQAEKYQAEPSSPIHGWSIAPTLSVVHTEVRIRSSRESFPSPPRTEPWSGVSGLSGPDSYEGSPQRNPSVPWSFKTESFGSSVSNPAGLQTGSLEVTSSSGDVSTLTPAGWVVVIDGGVVSGFSVPASVP